MEGLQTALAIHCKYLKINLYDFLNIEKKIFFIQVAIEEEKYHVGRVGIFSFGTGEL